MMSRKKKKPLLFSHLIHSVDSIKGSCSLKNLVGLFVVTMKQQRYTENLCPCSLAEVTSCSFPITCDSNGAAVALKSEVNL